MTDEQAAQIITYLGSIASSQTAQHNALIEHIQQLQSTQDALYTALMVVVFCAVVLALRLPGRAR